jgi:hypothetical protein
MRTCVSLLRAVTAASAVLLLAASGLSQSGVIKFDPTRDLDGFEECMGSEFKDVYPIARYEALLGKELSAPELEKLKETWKSEVQQARKEIEALRADPLGVYLHHLHHKLAVDAYFSKIAWTEDRSAAPFVFIVQKPAKEDPEYAKRVVGLYLPWLQKLAQIFDARYVKPLALKRRAEPAGYAVCILASQGDYSNYSRLASSDFTRVGSPVEMAVGFEDPFETGGSPTRKRYPVLSRAVRSILASYAADGADLSLWMASGMPGYLAYHEGLLPDSLDERRVDDEGLSLIIATLQKKDRRAVLLHPVEDLLVIDDSEALAMLVKKRAADARVKEPAWSDLLQAIQVQSVLWMHFLQDSSNGKYRTRFMKYFSAELSGRRGAEAFKGAFDGVDLAALNREFFAFVLDERERAHPTQKLDRAMLDKLFEDRVEKPDAAAPNAAPGSAATGSTAGALSTSGAAFKPSTLAVDSKDFAAQHGLALLRAQHGDLEGARKLLQDLAAQKPAAPEDVRIARDIERLPQLVLLRDGFLASLVQSGSKWSSEFQGKKFVAKVEKIEAGAVRLGDNKAGIASIPLAELEPAEIAKLADRKDKQGEAAPWSRAYAYIVSGDARWEKLSRDPSPAARDLYQDAKAWYPEVLRTGEAARALDALSKSALPKTRDEGEAALASIRKLLAAAGDLPLVKSRTEGLRALATAAAEQSFVAEDPSAMIHGAYSSIGDGRVKIVYDFKKPDQLLDFTKQAGYLKEWAQGFGALKRNEAESSFTIENGVLVGKGGTCYRLKLGFAAPITVRCSFYWQNVEIEDAAGSNFMLGMCDDNKGNCIAAGGAGYILVDDKKSSFYKRSTDATPGSYTIGQTYKLEIQDDGSKVTTFVDGVQRHEASCGPLKSGGVFLWVHGDYPLGIQHLEIEGAIDPASLKRLKSEWIAKQVAELGFK